MLLKSKFKVKSVGMLVAFMFYAVVGIVCSAILVMDFRLIHIGIIGILSLTTAYGLFKSRIWTLWVVVALFFTAITFSTYTFYSVFKENLLLDISMITFFILTWYFTIYIAVKRKTFES